LPSAPMKSSSSTHVSVGTIGSSVPGGGVTSSPPSGAGGSPNSSSAPAPPTPVDALSSPVVSGRSRDQEQRASNRERILFPPRV
jgi:hypothetical protein